MCDGLGGCPKTGLGETKFASSRGAKHLSVASKETHKLMKNPLTFYRSSGDVLTVQDVLWMVLNLSEWRWTRCDQEREGR
jgi:hypothetical protein